MIGISLALATLERVTLLVEIIPSPVIPTKQEDMRLPFKLSNAFPNVYVWRTDVTR